ncbi:aliphatic sulfonate ABC transporter substrate-binding protein (plasmid) [Comamonadaceae bacterium OTU4NAUVB1]|nr:aliphatic sulfonate ABC transporter substrate-binding protein [Comamonadaceae bacterium OTU4NAUVB1]
MKRNGSILSRRAALVAMAGLAGSRAVSAQGAPAPATLRIGYQKSSTLIAVLKAQGTLERRLALLGVKPAWHEFTSGLPLLEALNLDNLDVTADVADTVPVFAQAAGARLTFVAREAPSPGAQAILVRADSPLRRVADLKGRKVGFAKAAGAHYLLIAALAQAGLSLRDVEPAYLTPADGRAAFERGAIDAWVVWDPFLAAAERQSGARVLSDGTGIASYQRYYLARTPFARSRPDVLDALYVGLVETGRWVKRRPADAAALLAPVWGVEAAIVERANGRRSYDVRPVLATELGEQQRIADAFLAEKLLPRRVDARDVDLFQPATPVPTTHPKESA